MKLNPVSIYTASGQIRKNAYPAEKKHAVGTAERQRRAPVKAGLAEKSNGFARMASLSGEEKSRITDLFGRFDLALAGEIQKAGVVDDRPGQIIDIVV